MLIDELPGVYFKEKIAYELSGEGSKIPIFIGRTGNTTITEEGVYKFVSYNNEDQEEEWGTGTVKETGVVNEGYLEVEVLTNSTVESFVGQKFYVTSDAVTDGSVVYPLFTDAGTTPANIYVTIVKEEYKVDGTSYLTFNKISDALRETVVSGNKWEKETGIGVPSEENDVATVIQEFYHESKLLQSTDIGVPYIYVIDVGDGTDKTAWLNALETAKTLTDATVEIYIGAENITDLSLKEFLIIAVDSIAHDTEELDLRYGFTTQKDATDEELKTLASDLRSSYNDDSLYRLSRLGLCEPLLFGKTMSRICCTPYNTEPGFLEYRSVTPNTFKKRTKEQMKSLQDAGIIFNRDEQVNSTKHPKINLCVSTSFGATNDRPADALFHARFNADDLLREVFEICYTQIKANESATNIAYLQTKINKVVNDRVLNEEMVRYDDRTEQGTKLTVVESVEEPYNLIVTGQIQPVKCTIAIKVEATIKI